MLRTVLCGAFCIVGSLTLPVVSKASLAVTDQNNTRKKPQIEFWTLRHASRNQLLVATKNVCPLSSYLLLLFLLVVCYLLHFQLLK